MCTKRLQNIYAKQKPTSPDYSSEAIKVEQKSASVTATQKGYLQLIDDEKLMKVACQVDVLLSLESRPSEYLIKGSPLVLVYPQEHIPPKLIKQINKAFIVGKERTEKQDISFPIEQLAEVSLRALSPGINDPFTAMCCLDRLGAGFSHLVQRDFPSPYRYDNRHRLRVIVKPVTFEALVDRAFTPIRQYGQSDSMVMMQLLNVIALLATYSRTQSQRAVLRHHAELALRGSQEGSSEEYDRNEVKDHYQNVLEALSNAS